MNLQRFSYFIGLILICTVVPLHETYATHNRAGEITYIQTGPLSIHILVTTYTKTSSQSADRDSLEIFWGDGTSNYVFRSNGEGEPIENDIKINYYEANHTYPGRGTYTVGFTDPNRVNNILNVNWPNSVDVEFYLSTTFTFLDPQFQGQNSSAILLQEPIDIACVGKRFTHNPNAYDADGDSLSYHLVPPRMSADAEVPNYVYPSQISPGPENRFSIDDKTGDIVWDAPQLQGEYNIAIRIDEWRKGVLINSIIRDMQILVKGCDNNPPTIVVPKEICVIAGDVVQFDILIDDIDVDQKVKLTYTGGPFEVERNKAEIDQAEYFLEPPYTSQFVWETTCNHISKEYYQVVLKAEDNGLTGSSGLATLTTVKIKVVGPPPLDLTSDVENSAILLSWQAPYTCEITENEFFQGFSVWRKIGSRDISEDVCAPGLSNTSYQKIIYATKNIKDGRYFAEDTNVEKGKSYCYRVQAEFAKITANGNPYNRIESLASEEVCEQLARDLPLITKNTIVDTDIVGVAEINFAKPLARELDTLKNPGPYRYELFRSINDNMDYKLVNDFTRETAYFTAALDTTYLDKGVNTSQNQLYYKVLFYSDGNLLGASAQASSIYLSISAQDKSLKLDWEVDTPWGNILYNIYSLDSDGMYVLLDSTDNVEYTHTNLENTKEYCYYIASEGRYGLNGIKEPLINLSQKVCAVPVDNMAPCVPVLTVANNCILDEQDQIEWGENLLSFGGIDEACAINEQVAFYNIYYTPYNDGELILIDQVEDKTYIHVTNNDINGCYAITAFDNNGNESGYSRVACTESCPEYELPNTFTPNGDNSNDVYLPRKNRFINRIDLVIYNEWGNEVFRTSDPAIKWDGNDEQGKHLPEGTYYYSCRVYELSVGGIEQGDTLLSGYIHLIR